MNDATTDTTERLDPRELAKRDFKRLVWAPITMLCIFLLTSWLYFRGEYYIPLTVLQQAVMAAMCFQFGRMHIARGIKSYGYAFIFLGAIFALLTIFLYIIALAALA